ncbi:Gfo/Idh/MocA family protein [Alienimonas chondri]|uniref:Inositol 2-dehydrogenase/D-chiro-inositol 3-dehydrogenase n=1 Tax=Alienimonas chondri TaxID=2681879 RepID=A0ABX1VGX7_9PLAN|nr:Gfo/Idh/MocA family oxidoreductase [Alienimonas chondri]NNJ27120.1 Inositol 2-dehydrogenase/D-chiro-inositol 3-dehydrogenase [Alienimonas chondri]
MSDRRTFLSTAAAAGAALGVTPLAGAHVQEGGPVKIGLVGCGGRGTGAAAQALRAEPNATLVGVADPFQDKVDRCLKGLAVSDVADRVKVTEDATFVGLDGYKKLIAMKPDVILLATPTYYRPEHLEACVDAGIHTFFEKPAAVDAPGVRRVLATIKKAKENNVGLLGGLCWRYDPRMADLVDRVQNGQIGDLINLDSIRHSGYERTLAKRDEWSDTEWKLRSWYNLIWLSGDFIVEQFVHDLDMLCWMKGEYPKEVVATGGRINRVGENNGNIYDHFACNYTFADGVQMHATTRQQPGAPANPYRNLAHGTKGTANLMKFQITGENKFWNRESVTQMHQAEHNVFFEALRKGETPNDVEYMALSTLCGIMGREAAYTGENLSWDQMLTSTKQWGPDTVFSMDQELEVGEIPVPGKSKFS